VILDSIIINAREKFDHKKIKFSVEGLVDGKWTEILKKEKYEFSDDGTITVDLAGIDQELEGINLIGEEKMCKFVDDIDITGKFIINDDSNPFLCPARVVPVGGETDLEDIEPFTHVIYYRDER